MSISRTLFLFAGLCAASSVNCSAPTAPRTPALDPESYAFYSSLYRYSIGLESQEVITIAAQPLPFPEGKCLAPSTREEREMVAAAKRESPQSEWRYQFDFGRSYLVVPPSQIHKAVSCVSQHHASGCEPYTDSLYVRFLSVPVFNANHTRALVTIHRVCGGLCGNGGTQVYRKIRERWALEPNSFAKCLWAS